MVAIVIPPSSPVMPMPSRNAASKPPRKLFVPPIGACAIEYPITIHSTGMVRMHQKFIINMLRTFRLRSIPP